MWGPLQAKLGKGYQTFRSILATNMILVTCLTFRVSGFPVVPVPVKNTPDLRIATAHSWAGPLPKLVFEATTQWPHGAVSQSGQWAPFNAGYEWFDTTGNGLFCISEYVFEAHYVRLFFEISIVPKASEIASSDRCGQHQTQVSLSIKQPESYVS